MKVRVTTKKPGNVLNVRAGMSGKKNEVIVGTLPDQLELDAVETSNDTWFKVDTVVDGETIKGYIRAELVTVIPTEIKVEANVNEDEMQLDLPTDDENENVDDKVDDDEE